MRLNAALLSGQWRAALFQDPEDAEDSGKERREGNGPATAVPLFSSPLSLRGAARLTPSAPDDAPPEEPFAGIDEDARRLAP